MRINFPAESFVLDQLPLAISGLPKGARVNVEASTSDAEGTSWLSQVTFEADSNGTIDTSRQAPIEGDYTCIDSLGLLWSMKANGGTGVFAIPDNDRITYKLRVRTDPREAPVETIFVRALSTPNLTREEIDHNGLRGVVYRPSTLEAKAGVIFIGGSGGGVNELAARVIASSGFAVFTLAYFAYPGRPRDLQLQPLEYFDEAIEHFQAQPYLAGKGIFLMGGSRGGEAALLVGAHTKQKLSGIVANTPSSVAYGSVKHRDSDDADERNSAWTWNGAPLVAAPYDEKAAKDAEASLAPINARMFFLKAKQDDPDSYAQAAIAVERIRCPVLLTCATDDTIWPADIFCQEILKRAQTHGNGHFFQLMKHKDAGHWVRLPGIPPVTASTHPVTGACYLYGGTVQGNGQAAFTEWRGSVDFMESVLGAFK